MLRDYHAFVDCFGKKVIFSIPGQPEFCFEGKHVDRPLRLISILRPNSLLMKGCQGFLAYVVSNENDLKLEDIPVVRDFPDVFLDDLSGLPPEREVEFTIDLVLGITPISKTPYKMAPVELKKLKIVESDWVFLLQGKKVVKVDSGCDLVAEVASIPGVLACESGRSSVAECDGILRLGFKEIVVGNATPIWYNLIRQGLVQEDIFSFWLNRDPQAIDGGEIVFGGVDKRHFKGQHTYASITQKGYWQFEMGEFLIGYQSTGFCEAGCAAIVDSRTSLIVGPTAIVTEINHAIGVEGIYVPYMPDVTFTIVDKHFTLTPKEYVLKTGEGIATVCPSGFLEKYSWDCELVDVEFMYVVK
ncbi:cathepsin D-like [Vitis riparia]|uniref:cathepsin D-like n=1 Tax=Vitis riparia TaxID=96939 RepID=UPI00155A8F50|nr:cathepsin D-like [Vitis riparia]